MKSKWDLIRAVVQLVFGVLAIAAFIILLIDGENMTKWILTLLLAAAMVIVWIIGVIDYTKKK